MISLFKQIGYTLPGPPASFPSLEIQQQSPKSLQFVTIPFLSFKSLDIVPSILGMHGRVMNPGIAKPSYQIRDKCKCYGSISLRYPFISILPFIPTSTSTAPWLQKQKFSQKLHTKTFWVKTRCKLPDIYHYILSTQLHMQEQ